MGMFEPSKSTAASPKTPRKVRVQVPEAMRRRMVADAAYFIAQRRNFIGGSPQEDWLAAEAEIERLLTDTAL